MHAVPHPPVCRNTPPPPPPPPAYNSWLRLALKPISLSTDQYLKMMAFSFLLLRHLAICILSMAVVSSTSPFLPNTPGREWKMVGYLDMTDPTQQCPDSWQKITSPRSSCGKNFNSGAFCDSLNIPTSGASYHTVCGRFRGYQVGSTDAFRNFSGPISIERFYVDGVTVTYGPPGRRHHVFTYAAGVSEINISSSTCPCIAGGQLPPLFVGSDYYCESGCPGPDYVLTQLYFSDVLWDGQQCGGNEITCCNASYLPWFCKTFPTPISEDLEVRICTDEDIGNENVAIESFELYIQGETTVCKLFYR